MLIGQIKNMGKREKIGIYGLAFMAFIFGMTTIYLGVSRFEYEIKNKNLQNKSVQDSLNYYELEEELNDVSLINLTLRNVIAKNPRLERELLKDTAYIELSSKRN